jgi:hypothetical protein
MITLRRGGKKIKGAEVYPKLELLSDERPALSGAWDTAGKIPAATLPMPSEPVMLSCYMAV